MTIHERETKTREYLRRRVPWIALLSAAALALTASSAAASGSYVGASSHRAGLDDYAKYELGKHLASGKIELAEFAKADGDQGKVLVALQAQLPRGARNRIDLPAFAGRLDSGQLEAIRYYLKVRFKVR